MAERSGYSEQSGPRNRSLRVGNSERDAVAEILRREHVAGRLTSDEFDERLTRCLGATTYADLDDLIADLPVDEPEPRRRVGFGRPWPLPLMLVPVLALAIAFSHGRAAWLVVPFAFWFVVRPLVFGRWHGYGGPGYAVGCRPYRSGRPRGG
jgi:hypothetical protein